jgi:hypothetical protein
VLFFNAFIYKGGEAIHTRFVTMVNAVTVSAHRSVNTLPPGTIDAANSSMYGRRVDAEHDPSLFKTACFAAECELYHLPINLFANNMHSAITLVAKFDDDTYAGSCHLTSARFALPTIAHTHRMPIDAMYLHSLCCPYRLRQSGIGSKLLQAAKDHGTWLYLTVRNPRDTQSCEASMTLRKGVQRLMSFYTKHRFQHIGTLPDDLELMLHVPYA